MNDKVLLKSITLKGFILSRKHLIRILKAPLRILCSTRQPRKDQGCNVIMFYVFKASPLPPLPPIRSWNAWSQCNISSMADAVLMMTAGLSRNACRCRSLWKKTSSAKCVSMSRMWKWGQNEGVFSILTQLKTVQNLVEAQWKLLDA